MRTYIVTADGCEHILKRCLAELVRQPVLVIFTQYVDITSAHDFELTVQALTSNLDIDSTLMNFQVAADFATGGSRTRKIQPVAGWMSRATGHDIHNVAASEFVVQRHHARDQTATFACDDVRTSTAVTNLGMDTIGKIKGR